MTALSTDRIEKQIVLRAPRSRVWQAITNAREFGAWFGAELQGDFAPGARVQGPITNEGYTEYSMDVTVERIEPERLFSFRWHPGMPESPDMDLSGEPTTLVTFELEEVAEGTRLTIVESGFDGIPLARRAAAFESNDEGWAMQLRNIEEYLRKAA